MLFNYFYFVYSIDEDIVASDIKMGNTALMVDGYKAITTIPNKGKAFYLESAIIYRIPKENNDLTKISPLNIVDPENYDEPNEYTDIKIVADMYIAGERNWNNFLISGSHFSKLVELAKRYNDEEFRTKRQISSETKINELIKYVYSNRYVMDLSQLEFQSGYLYTIRYSVFYSLDKKPVIFFSNTFSYNKSGDYLEMDDSIDNWYSSWWAILLYILGACVILGIILNVCMGNK